LTSFQENVKNAFFNFEKPVKYVFSNTPPMLIVLRQRCGISRVPQNRDALGPRPLGWGRVWHLQTRPYGTPCVLPCRSSSNSTSVLSTGKNGPFKVTQGNCHESIGYLWVPI